MTALFLKEIRLFFTSFSSFLYVGIYLLVMSLLLWVFPDTSILDFQYATLDPFFDISPVLFIFLIPALTMKAITEERQTGNLEFLLTKPLTDLDIVMSKFLSYAVIVVFCLVPTVIYFVTISTLAQTGNDVDAGGILGSYIGLFLLGLAFVSIGIFVSCISRNQIASFVLASLLCFLLYQGFELISRLPFFLGRSDYVIEQLGLRSHYISMSRGLLDFRDFVYFLSVILIFVSLTILALQRIKESR